MTRSARSTARGRWQWPLQPRPAVLKRFDPPAQRWGAGHRGVDVATEPGAVVLAPEDGVIAYVGHIAGRPVLSIDHADGLRSTYEPVIATLPVGTSVGAGDPVGRIDTATQHCTGTSCMHWGVKQADAYLDPLSMVTAPAPILLPLQ